MLSISQIAPAWELFEHGIPKSRIAAGERVSSGKISVTIEINKRVTTETLLYNPKGGVTNFQSVISSQSPLTVWINSNGSCDSVGIVTAPRGGARIVNILMLPLFDIDNLKFTC